MSKRYPGNFITGNPVALTQSSNAGVWDLKDNYQATSNGTWQEGDGIYEIGRSLRFSRGASPSLTRTPSVTSNTKVCTWSFWVKQSTLATGRIFTSRSGSSFPAFGINLANNYSGTQVPNITIDQYTTGAAIQMQLIPTMLFRDPSAWFNLVVAIDTTQSIASDRVKLYYNGEQITRFSLATYPSQNLALNFNTSGIPEYIGADPANGGYYDGFMAETHKIDGQQLDSSYFGYTDSITNIWQPKRYTGTYGTNGFYLPFSQNNSLPNLGKNFAGSNYITNSELFSSGWTLNNVTIGSAVTAPNGTNTALTLTDNSTNGHHTAYIGGSSIPSGSDKTFTLSCYAKAGTRNVFGIWEPYSMASYATFDLSTGTVTGTGYGGIGAIQFVGNGWYRCSVTFSTNGTSIGIGLSTAINDTYPGTSYVGSGQTIFIWGAQINLGTSADPYIATTSTVAINDWTPNNFSLTAGATYDSMVDSPTNVFTTTTDTGGVVSGNYCTWNPIHTTYDAGDGRGSYSNANLVATKVAGQGSTNVNGTIAFNTGKWYWEVAVTTASSTVVLGISAPGSYNALTAWRNGVGGNLTGTASSVYGASFVSGNTNTQTISNNDIIGIAVDADAQVASFYKNGTFVFSVNINTSNVNYYTPFIQLLGDSQTATLNAGQRPFAYTPPAGFKSLNTTNLQALGSSAVGKAAIISNKWMDVNLYGGTGTTQKVTNTAGFAPDLVWVKSRSNAYNHILVDSVRGAGNIISSDLSSAEQSVAGYWITGLDSDGFTLGSAGANGTNVTGSSYVGWQWKQSPAAGFNIVPYTGDGTNNKSISHNLGVKPSMIFIKNRDATGNWLVEHVGLPDGRILLLNDMQGQSGQFLNEYRFYQRTTSNFLVGSFGAGSNSNNNGQKYIAYLWAEVPGFSKFGSYIGNGSADGPFVYTGFCPKYMIYKRIDSTNGHWGIADSIRSRSNVTQQSLYANLSNAGGEADPDRMFDFVSNGFKIRTTSGSYESNASGATYVYAAFAESPFGLNNRAR